MDRGWRPKSYQPTAQPLVPFTSPSPKDLDLLQRQLQALSTCIAREPYDIHNWLARTGILLALGYPELALGDCYRAEILLSRCRCRPDKDVRDEGECQRRRPSGIPSATDTEHLQNQAGSSQKPDEQSDDKRPSSSPSLTQTSTEHDTLECRSPPRSRRRVFLAG